MNPFPITALYAGALGFVLVWLSLRVVQARWAREVSLGDGGHEDLLIAQRAHGNFAEYVPLAVILIGLAEAGGTAGWAVHALGAVLVVGRIAHPFGLAMSFGVRPARGGGFVATLLVIALGSGLAIRSGLG